jgi:hypothetical protein
LGYTADTTSLIYYYRYHRSDIYAEPWTGRRLSPGWGETEGKVGWICKGSRHKGWGAEPHRVTVADWGGSQGWEAGEETMTVNVTCG